MKVSGRFSKGRRDRVAVGMVLLIPILVAPFATVSIDAAAPVVVPEMLAQVLGSPTMYLVDLVGCEQLRCLELLRTSVSATHFSVVTLPPLSPVKGELMGDLRRLVFATRSDGYALVGENYPFSLYRTTNGARTWQRVAIGREKTIVGLAVSSRLLYTVTAQCSAMGVCRDYQVNRSALRAQRWTSTPLPHLGRAEVVSSDFSPNISAYGSDVWIEELMGDRSTIFASHDEGTTYAATSAKPLASVSGCDITAASTSSLWAQCPTGNMISVLHSSDGGVTWSNVSKTPFSGTGGGSFDAVSANLAYLAYGYKQPLDRFTSDGGEVTVRGRLACPSSYSSLSDLSFSDERHGLVLCSPGGSWQREKLLKTSDGGIHWLQVSAN